MTIQPRRRFVVVSGLPGSGKSTLARQLSLALKLPVIDKDDILEALFETKGVGDAAWRRKLSRESDAALKAEAAASSGAILVSFWHQPGMSPDSGTPTEWFSELCAHVVNVHCVCPPEVAAERFSQRRRHRGHLDIDRSAEEVAKSIRESAAFGLIEVDPRIEVDTSREVDVPGLVRRIAEPFCGGPSRI